MADHRPWAVWGPTAGSRSWKPGARSAGWSDETAWTAEPRSGVWDTIRHKTNLSGEQLDLGLQQHSDILCLKLFETLKQAMKGKTICLLTVPYSTKWDFLFCFVFLNIVKQVKVLYKYCKNSQCAFKTSCQDFCKVVMSHTHTFTALGHAPTHTQQRLQNHRLSWCRTCWVVPRYRH